MTQKIIHVLCHSLRNDKDLYHFVFGGFGSVQAKGIRKYFPKYNYEVWYPVIGLRKPDTIYNSGIKYRLFPAKSVSKIVESYFGLVTSDLLIGELSKQDPDNTIVHFQGERGSLLHTILTKFPELKIVLQYHGYGQPYWLEWLERLFITPLERKNFRNIRHFFVPIRCRAAYLKQQLRVSPSKISFENIGIDYALFRPGKKDRARGLLDIPKKSYVMCYVGPAIASKGVHVILSAYSALKKKHNELYLMLIGCRTTDPLYKQAARTADKLVAPIPNKDMPLYYQACDVLCFLGNQKMRKYAGPGIAPTEALACNVNVISTNLHHFPDKIYRSIGIVPTNENDFVRKLEHLINKPTVKFNARNAIAPYVAFNNISKSIGKIYAKIFKEDHSEW